jgi:hypothetical protein
MNIFESNHTRADSGSPFTWTQIEREFRHKPLTGLGFQVGESKSFGLKGVNQVNFYTYALQKTCILPRQAFFFREVAMKWIIIAFTLVGLAALSLSIPSPVFRRGR